jgi:ribonuclease HII
MPAQENSSFFPQSEQQRLFELMHFEREARRKGFSFPAGIDEAGRGPLAGPVVASACILPSDFQLSGINDSKLLTPSQRRSFYELLTNHPEIHYGIGIVQSDEIDRINILEATKLAMLQAIQKLTQKPDFLLIDAVALKQQTIPMLSLIKGDRLSQSIAAASVIAKETRDRLMVEMDKKWPQYGFQKHKGYGTLFHREAIAKHGPCEIHRFSFEPIKSMQIEMKPVSKLTP